MASPAAALPPGHELVPPPDPQAIRACLTPSLAAEFDSEWEIVLERAKQSKDLAGVHDLLNKWRHTAYMEMRDPGRTTGCWPRPSRSCAPATTRTRCRSRACRR